MASFRIKHINTMALFSITLAVTTQAVAAKPCVYTNTQAQINQCAAYELAIEDRKLNHSYTELQNLLSTTEKKQLKNVQLAWIDFRDKACKFSARDTKGGSIYSTVLNSCLTTYTEQRRTQLDDEIASINK